MTCEKMVTMIQWMCKYLLCCGNVSICQNLAISCGSPHCITLLLWREGGTRPPAAASPHSQERTWDKASSVLLVDRWHWRYPICGIFCIKRKLCLNQSAHTEELVSRCSAVKPLEGSIRVLWPFLQTWWLSEAFALCQVVLGCYVAVKNAVKPFI